ncbi:MAG: PD-(D/E)XK nuclease family protein, partial [Actinomycetota bacterium]|nr:PD-(D/E)XK nuclease family protein [Actinomycetota bacterium]
TGVTTGPLRDGVGRDLDLVILLGVAEGLAPGRMREDPLLPDSVKRSAGPGLPDIDARFDAAKTRFHRVLSTGAETIVMAPRGNLRGGGSYELSRWISSGLSKDYLPEELSSYGHGVRTGAGTASHLAPTEQEWRLRSRLAPVEKPWELEDKFLAAALDVRADRRLGRFTRFNGNLGSMAGSIVDTEKAISPTSLEDWVANPFGYFLKGVLKVRIFEDLELELQVGPARRGELMHAALEDYVRGITEEGKAPSEMDLDAAAEASFAADPNPAWLAHIWERDKSIMLKQLREAIAADAVSAEDGWFYQQPEAGFGPAEYGPEYQYPPVELALPDGSAVHFLGKVDRVDRRTDGTVRVIDYKTGKPDKFKDLCQEDPTAGGTKFQLPVYGLFARRLQQDPAAPVSAEYWFISRDGKRIGYQVDAAVVERLQSDVAAIFGALRRGIFPHRPETSHFKNYSTMAGHQNVSRTWDRLSQAAELQKFPMLLEGSHDH